MSQFMKQRALPPSNRSFGDSMKRGRQLSQRTSFKMVEGQFNSFFPKKDAALWFAVCPTQQWNSAVYDREKGEVVEQKGEFYFVYTNHRVASSKRNFTCSAGPHKNKDCWGCGIRNKFYDDKRAKKEETGIEEKGEAPISGMVQYAFSGVLLETIAKVRLMDGSGRPKVNKKGEPIFREVPTKLLAKEEAARLKADGATTFGLPVHYSVGITHYNAILQFDDEMQNYCANCAELLLVSEFVCPECTTAHQVENEDHDPLSGQDLLEMRGEDLQCTCGYFGRMIPTCQCVCGDPQEGSLVDFALRLISKKVSDTSTVLEYTGVRPIKSFIEKHPSVEAMLATPLKIDEIFAPTPLSMQTNMIPEHLRGDGVSPRPKKRGGEESPAAAVPYSLASGDDDD